MELHKMIASPANVAAWSDAQVCEMLAISKGHLRHLLARSTAAGLPFPGADLGSDGRALRRWTPDLPGLLRWAVEVKAWRASASEARATPSDGVTNRGALDAPRLKLRISRAGGLALCARWTSSSSTTTKRGAQDDVSQRTRDTAPATDNTSNNGQLPALQHS